MKILASPGLAIRPYNPYCYLLYTHVDAEVTEYSLKTALIGGYDVFHFHWPESALSRQSALYAYARLQAKLLLIDYLRARGTKIVWTVHNLKSHERRHPAVESWFWNTFTRKLHGFLALSATGLELARERFPVLNNIPGYVVPHGHYRGEYPDYTRSEARSQLGIPASSRVILNFGQVRPYKNIDKLITTFRQLPNPDLMLLVAGGGREEELAQKIRNLAAGDPRIRLDLRQIPHEDVGKYMRAADIVVLPYKDILNSGTALLGLSFDRPVAVSGFGAMTELAATVGDDWVHLLPGDLNVDSLQESLAWLEQTPRPETAPLAPLDWTVLGKLYMQSLRKIVEA